MTHRTRRQFDSVELLLCCVLTGAAAVMLTLQQSAVDKQAEYLRRFGPKVSAGPEEWIARDFFNDQRGGVFVDVGAADYRHQSNTYTLETRLGWSGVAIDAQVDYAGGYRLHRPRTRFIAAFVSDAPGTVTFAIPTGAPRGTASADLQYTGAVDRQFGRQARRTERLPTTTITGILNQAGIVRFDFLSMDIERWEPKALGGLDIERFRPRLACVEAHDPVRQAIINYFAVHRYVVVGKYLKVDPMNLYFTPIP